jgi:hypothetical protein
LGANDDGHQRKLDQTADMAACDKSFMNPTRFLKFVTHAK